MNVLVTGATGFLGSHLVRRLLGDGHEVAAFKRHNSSLCRVFDIAKDLAWYYADDADLSLPFRKHVHFDAVIHTATCYGRQGESFSTIFEANTAFPVRLLETAAHFKIDTFFNTDTYFNTNSILCSHLNAYSLSKKHFTEWGRLVAESGAIRFANIKLEHIYGPGDSPTKFTAHIIRQCLNNEPTIRLTNGEQLRDFIHINDVVDAYILLLEKKSLLPADFITCGLGTGTAVSIREFVENVHHISNSSSKLYFGALPYRDNEIMKSAADITLLSSLGWKPLYSIKRGLLEVIDGERKSQTTHTTE